MKPPSVRRRIEALVAQWRPLLGLERWRIALLWNEREHIATCRAKPAYEDAVIAFNLPTLQRDLRGQPARATAAWLEELVVHELVHCCCWRSSERSVTMISRALLRLRHAQRSRMTGRY